VQEKWFWVIEKDRKLLLAPPGTFLGLLSDLRQSSDKHNHAHSVPAPGRWCGLWLLFFRFLDFFFLTAVAFCHNKFVTVLSRPAQMSLIFTTECASCPNRESSNGVDLRGSASSKSGAQIEAPARRSHPKV
jgi:hypothetical protein